MPAAHTMYKNFSVEALDRMLAVARDERRRLEDEDNANNKYALEFVKRSIADLLAWKSYRTKCMYSILDTRELTNMLTTANKERRRLQNEDSQDESALKIQQDMLDSLSEWIFWMNSADQTEYIHDDSYTEALNNMLTTANKERRRLEGEDFPDKSAVEMQQNMLDSIVNLSLRK